LVRQNGEKVVGEEVNMRIADRDLAPWSFRHEVMITVILWRKA
jgi:hypothetical protein